jgi:signal transduction histidine kinase
MMEMVGELNEQQSSYIKKIILGVETMARLVNNLLDLGRIEAGVDLQLEMVSVEDIVERVTSNIQLQASQKQIQLTTEFNTASVPPIQADSALLTQALQNLFDNAIKYTDANGKVHLKVSLNPETVAFEISDTGIGIAPVDQPRLFEKFYRGAQRDARKRQGSGLGLAIVKSIAERHGGRVWVNSQLGKGSTFGLEIPLRQSVPVS